MSDFHLFYIKKMNIFAGQKPPVHLQFTLVLTVTVTVYQLSPSLAHPPRFFTETFLNNSSKVLLQPVDSRGSLVVALMGRDCGPGPAVLKAATDR